MELGAHSVASRFMSVAGGDEVIDMETLIDLLRELPLWQLAVIFLAENLLIFALVLLAGRWIARRFRHRPVSHLPPEVGGTDVRLALLTVMLNTCVTLAGVMLWRAGYIHFRTDTGWRAWLDVVVLLGVMDLLMYLLHRVAHARWLFPLMHRTHHNYERVRPLALFLLNPFENLGFGVLWLAVIIAYDASWLGMSTYLIVNVIFGAIGHLGVEPLPDSWRRIPLLNHLTTSSFHAQHHQHLAHNYGFYTLIWDRLFGTLSPRYETDFGRLPEQNLSATGRF